MLNVQLPTDILLYINEYVCKKILNVEYDLFEILYPLKKKSCCNVVHFLNYSACKFHDDYHYYSCLNTLANCSNSYYKCGTIHFDTKKAREHATPYLYLFGEVSHYCCEGKGVMFNIIYP